jgi:hypothetical protein
MPVPRTHAKFALAALALLAAPAARAQSVPFTFDKAIYADDKEGALRTPEGVACTDGQVVVADTGNARLVRYNLSGNSLAGGTPIKVAQITYPVRVQIDSKGNLLVLDQKARKIVRLDPQGGFLGTVEVKGGSGVLSTLPVAFKLDVSDNFYVLDVASNKMVVLDPAGTAVRQVELPKGKPIFTDIHVDSGGTVYGVDAVDGVVWVLEKGTTAFKPLGPSLKDRMSFPVYITGRGGRLFLVDQNGHGIVVLGTDGSFQGRQLAIGWGAGALYYPSQMCLTPSGYAFIADRSNNRVQMFATAK